MATLTTKRIPVSDLRPGMAIAPLGTPHTVERIEPSTSPLPEISHTITCTDGYSISGETDGGIRVVVA